MEVVDIAVGFVRSPSDIAPWSFLGIDQIVFRASLAVLS